VGRLNVHKSFYEFDMRVLSFCKGMGRSKNSICQTLTSSLGYGGMVAERVDDLVARGLLTCFLFGKKRLDGSFKGKVVDMFVISDEGAQALFYFEQSKKFYCASEKKRLEVPA